MEKEIKRDYYLDQLIARIDNGLIKVVTGIRRCGKSYLLRQIFKKYLLKQGVPSDHIIEMALICMTISDFGIRKYFIRGS